MRQILVKVWQKRLTPEQALKELIRAGPKQLNLGKEETVLELLEALSEREITTTEAEEEVQYVWKGNRNREDLCQI